MEELLCEIMGTKVTCEELRNGKTLTLWSCVILLKE